MDKIDAKSCGECVLKPGLKNTICDVPGLLVGNATDDALQSGVTVLTSPNRFAAGVHVMGGAPGTRETDLLAPDRLVTHIDAITLSGGSAFGLDAAGGVVEGLKAQSRGHAIHELHVPIVPAAIIFDLRSGDQGWSKNPYPGLGRAAFETASDGFELGPVGAGFGARAGRDAGGLGSASLKLPSGITVGALVVVNPLGNVRTVEGHFYAAPFEVGDEFGALGAPFRQKLADTFVTKLDPNPQGNTTIAIVATDACLSKPELTRLATTAHGGLAKAINPSHTLFDGDLIFAVSTEGRGTPNLLEQMDIGHAASITLARAVARAVYLSNKRSTPLGE